MIMIYDNDGLIYYHYTMIIISLIYYDCYDLRFMIIITFIIVILIFIIVMLVD